MTEKKTYDAVIYGATGFTGKLIAMQMDRRGLRFAVAGRNAEKLRLLSSSLKSKPAVIVASVDDEAALEKMAASARVLVAAAGPFMEVGKPAARAAVAGGAHYMDTTGEQAFVRWASEELDEPAKKASVAVSPAMGFDVIPGDVAACLAARALGGGKIAPCARADVVYLVKAGIMTRGTTRSLLGIMAGGGFMFRNGAYEEAAPGQREIKIAFPGEKIKRRGILIPLGETVTIPRTIGADSVDTYMVMKPAEELFLKNSGPAMRFLMGKKEIRKLADRAIGLMPEGPDEKERAKYRWKILVRVKGRDGRTASVLSSGVNTYGMTGELLALYTSHLCKADFKGAGFLTPSQILPPEETLAGLKDFPIHFSEAVVE